jgi:signal transduction histidine kinase/ligand-binding sensor domain-containing protein
MFRDSGFRLLIFLFVLHGAPVEAQKYKRYEYHVKDGLPTDVVKDIVQDSLGFIWIATDDGLVKFNGHRFIHYKQALQSQYAKRFLKTRSGSIYLIGDLDLAEIVNRIDTVEFRSVLPGTRNPTDTTLWYPKSIYEDRAGSLWIGEPQSVVCWKQGKLMRFPFPMDDQTPVFTRSFSFFEDAAGRFYTASYPGRLYWFDPAANKFQSVGQLPQGVNQIITIDQQLWVAANEGVFKLNVEQPTGIHLEKVADIPAASVVTKLEPGTFLVTTFGKKHFLLKHNERPQPFDLSTKDVNSVSHMVDGTWWLSSSEGIVILQRNLFQPVRHTAFEPTFIESIAEDRITGDVYFATVEDVFRVRPATSEPLAEVVDHIPNQYFQSIVVAGNRLWASNRMQVFVYENGRKVKSWDLENEGRFVFDLIADRNGDVWASQDGSRNALRFTPDLQLHRVAVPLPPQATINVIRETNAGLYLCASGTSSYLFFKAHTDATFRNVSVPPSFETKGDLSIGEAIEANGVLWLASSEGLLRYTPEKLERVNLGERYSGQAVRTIERFTKNEILFGNSFGVFRYHLVTGEWSVYNDGSGLPANTVSNRGLLLAKDSTLWVGTSQGIAYSVQPIANLLPTQPPWIEQVLVNGNARRFMKGLQADYNSFIDIELAPNTFSTGVVTLQFRLADSPTWTEVTDNHIKLASLPPGDYEVYVRAKKTGGFTWSAPRAVAFTIRRPPWLQPWFFGAVLLLLFAISWFSYQVAKRVGRQRRETLEKLLSEITEKNQQLQAQAREINHSHRELQEKSEEVQAQAEELAESYETIQQLNEDLEKKVLEKSRDLVQTNEELSKYNADLLQFSYSISHNLRGPLARLMGLSDLLHEIHDREEVNRIVEMIKVSTVELDTVLRDLTNIIELRKNVSHIRDRVFFQDEWSRSCILLQDQILPTFAVRANFQEAPFIYGVRGLLQSILYNLLSNALKYRSHDRPLLIEAKTWREKNETVFQITDNGLGFDLREQQAKVFKLYKRFHTHVQGRGLGLYLVKTQTELLGGQVHVQSQLNEGTTFTIRLPDPESIERQVFYESETALLFYDANVNCTVINWKKEVTSQSYRAVFETVLNTLRTYHSPGWIADLRQQGIVPEADQKWFTGTILSEATKNGLLRIATIGFRDPGRVVYYERMQQRASELGFSLQDFESLPLALDWMAGGYRSK